MPRRSEPPCPAEAGHTPAPTGYVQKVVWMEELAATHDQQRCPGCGKWSIWVERQPAGNTG